MGPAASLHAWLTLHTLFTLLALAAYALLTLLRGQRRHPSAALGWVLFIALAPYLALPLFLLLGFRKTGLARLRARPAAHGRGADPQPGAGGHFRALAAGLGLPSPSAYRALQVHQDGAMALARLSALICSARHTLELSSFLLGRDGLGAQLADLLAERARQGVRVRLMIDGVGRYMGGLADLRPMRAAGVELALFRPPGSAPLRGHLNLRNHRKLAVADGQWLWTGGRNLAAEYFLGRKRRGRREPAWTDLSFDLQGPLAAQARQQFEHDWAMAAGTPPPRPPAPAADRPGPPPLAQLLPSGPDQADDTVHALLLDACFNARSRIVAVSPYFVPDPMLLMALCLAARRGVEVTLVLPRRSNHRLADLSRPQAIRELLDAGARVWLTRSMLHGKLVMVDQSLALAGSLNLDARSLFLNYELMIAFDDAHALGQFDAWTAAVMADADRLQPTPAGTLRKLAEGLLRWLSFQL